MENEKYVTSAALIQFLILPALSSTSLFPLLPSLRSTSVTRQEGQKGQEDKRTIEESLTVLYDDEMSS